MRISEDPEKARGLTGTSASGAPRRRYILLRGIISRIVDFAVVFTFGVCCYRRPCAREPSFLARQRVDGTGGTTELLNNNDGSHEAQQETKEEDRVSCGCNGCHG